MPNLIDSYKTELVNTIQEIDNKTVVELAELIIKTSLKGKKIFFVGNGGSAATASHFVCDLQKTSRQKINAICLNDNLSLLTAWANDYGYDYIFSEQLKNVGSKGDLLIIISASGNSANIINALKTAKKLGISTFGLLGFDGGRVKKMITNFMLIASNDYGVVEDMHLIINHMITAHLKKSM